MRSIIFVPTDTTFLDSTPLGASPPIVRTMGGGEWTPGEGPFRARGLPLLWEGIPVTLAFAWARTSNPHPPGGAEHTARMLKHAVGGEVVIVELEEP